MRVELSKFSTMSSTRNNGITIVVPVFNASKYIAQCIESIKAQKFTDWNCILINDGSQDESRRICENLILSDPRFTLINRTNQGAGASRNKGIELCSTNWITFVDADDTIDPDYLDNFDSGHLRENEISVQGYVRQTYDGKDIGESKNFPQAYFTQNEIAKSFSSHKLLDYGQTVGKLYPIKLLLDNNIRFCTTFRLSEDHVFFMSVLPHVEGIHFHSGSLYKYIEWSDGNNITSKKFPPDELWNRFLHLEACYSYISRQFVIDKEIDDWLRYFVFTGSLSLYIKSLRHSIDPKDTSKHIDNLKRKRYYCRKLYTQFFYWQNNKAYDFIYP